MILNVLAGGQMSLASAEVIRDPSHLPHLFSRQQSAWNFRADHLHALLALAVYAAAQAEGAELILSDLPREELIGLAPEQLDIFPDSGIVLLLSELAFGQDISGCHMISF